MYRKAIQMSTAEKFLERTNIPILILAALAVIFYLLELFHVIPSSLRRPFLWINFLIDLIFLIDILAKAIILGRSYLRSPWFLIDFVSTLPIISSTLELMGSLGPQLQATRVARGARIARIARVARIARLAKVARVARLATAIRSQRGLQFLKSQETGDTRLFNKSLFIGVPLLLFIFIMANVYITQSEVEQLKEVLQDEISLIDSKEKLNELIERHHPRTAYNPEAIATFRTNLDNQEDIVLSIQKGYVRADRITGILLLVLLLAIAIIAYISDSLNKDKTMVMERSILSQCFSPAIVNKFYESPESIERFFNQWMSVFFIDIRGFTKAVERDAEDVEGLALKLRKVMDTARSEIVVSHEGVIDKFMGDAVMGWVGGHFSSHWEIVKDMRERLLLDELEIIGQDIKSIQREIVELEKHESEDRLEIESLKSALDEAEEIKSALKEAQKIALDKDPDLQSSYQDLILEYRKRVAKSAVSCCLKINEVVEEIDDPDAFHELKIGIGSGPVLVGNFGSTDQIGFTVLGPTVNRSARLEPSSAQCGCKILVDQNTYDLLADNPDLSFRRLPKISVKGISGSITVYEPFFAHKVNLRCLETFEQGVKALELKNLEQARLLFHEANAYCLGGDLASQLWESECTEILKGGKSFYKKQMHK